MDTSPSSRRTGRVPAQQVGQQRAPPRASARSRREMRRLPFRREELESCEAPFRATAGRSPAGTCTLRAHRTPIQGAGVSGRRLARASPWPVRERSLVASRPDDGATLARHREAPVTRAPECGYRKPHPRGGTRFEAEGSSMNGLDAAPMRARKHRAVVRARLLRHNIRPRPARTDDAARRPQAVPPHRRVRVLAPA